MKRVVIFGCFQIRQSHHHPFHSVASIGTCKQKCDSENMGSYFDYRKRHQNNCACLSNKNHQSHQHRIESCVDSAYFFVYKAYDGEVRNSSDPGNCATICCDLCNVPTQNGNHLEGRRCSSVDGRIVGRCGARVSKWDLDYFGSLNFCIHKNRLLPASNYCQGNGKQNGQMSWTNVFREEVEIIKTKDFNENPERCFSGVFLYLKGRRILNISENRCSENKKWFLCKSNSSVTESITQSTFSTIDMSKGKQINISSGQSLTHSKDKTSHRTTGTIKTDTIAQSPLFTLDMSKATQTHYSSGQSFTSLWNKTSTTESSISTIFTSAAHKTVRKTGFTNDQRNNGDKSTSIGAVIGGILGACCILFVSAVLIVCKIRSKGIFKGTNKYVKEDTNEANFSNTIYQDSYNTDRTSAMPTSNQTYGLGGASISVYAVVNKLKKLENTAETYTDAAYGEYDHLHDIQNRRNCPQEKLYYSHGALRNEEDQTYDSSDFGNGKFNEGNALYDHSFSVVEGDYMSNENHDSHNSNNADIYDKAS